MWALSELNAGRHKGNGGYQRTSSWETGKTLVRGYKLPNKRNKASKGPGYITATTVNNTLY